MPFVLRSATVGALPIVYHFLARLRFSELLSRYLPLLGLKEQAIPG